jgi:hypothetical protein
MDKFVKAVLLAAIVTISVAENGDSRLTQGTEDDFVEPLNAKITTRQQFWGADTGAATDLIQAQAVRSSNPQADHDTLHLIEQDALLKAGFEVQHDEVNPQYSPGQSEQKDGDNAEDGRGQQYTSLPMQKASEKELQLQLMADQKKLLQMKMQTNQVNQEAEHEKAARQVMEGVGARVQEEEQFYSYMSRWWKLHRGWMKRHNVRLYERLREHRALSLSTLWKPFLLRWHYVQPRLLQGYRYNWKDDGTYETKRFLMKSTRKVGKQIIAARIRSVNNVCFPGLLPPDRRNKWCTYDRRISARAAQFTLRRAKFQSPSLTVMRAYTSFVPKTVSHVSKHKTSGWTKAAPAITFVSIQGLHWNLVEVIEYCDDPRSTFGVHVPQAFNPVTSEPTREYSLKFMEWQQMTMGRELLDTGATVENIELKTMDDKLRISCVVPIDHPQDIDGAEVKLTQQKCSMYVRQWDFNLKCPGNRVGSLALKTKVTARDDSGVGNGKPTMTPAFKSQLAFNKNRVSLTFEKQAVLHTHDKSSGEALRSSVPVIMTQSKNTQWTADPRFKTSRNLYFSFIVSNPEQVKEGILVWDPELAAHFNDSPAGIPKYEAAEKYDVNEATAKSGDEADAEFDATAFMQIQQSNKNSAAMMTCSWFWVLLVSTFAIGWS